MTSFQITALILIFIAAVSSVAALIYAVRAYAASVGTATTLAAELRKAKEELHDDIDSSRRDTAEYVHNAFRNYGELVFNGQTEQSKQQSQRLSEMSRTMHEQLTELRAENSRQLDQVRNVVDEKLQKTLDDRITQSFKIVNDRLEQVYKGLGEMQNLAVGVGDLKKVLSNVKTRGIMGEVQLGAILEQILSPEQYETNIVTKAGSGDRVEYAVRLPGVSDDRPCLLPIDAKFPGDTYSKLADAYAGADHAAAEQAGKALEDVIRREAKGIRDKYLDPPATTEFGILFLPFEGLYAEVVKRGLVEILQREYRVNIAGPTTMAALLNSLQMGFRTLAIEKHSSEAWEVLGAVKTEFERFEDVLIETRKRITRANDDLDKLIGPRTRSIRRSLRGVEKLDDAKSAKIIGFDDEENEY